MTASTRRPAIFFSTLVVFLQTVPPAEAFAPPSQSLAVMPSVTQRESLTTAHWFFRKRNEEKDNDVGEPSQPTPQEQQQLQQMHKQRLDMSAEQQHNARRSFLTTTAASAASASLLPRRASASAPTSSSTNKLVNLPADELKQIILSDVVDKSFLVTADITRSIYDESATFTDEIDVYTMDKWIKGTKALFVPSGSRVSLVGDVEVSPKEATFRFDEDLMFNIPFKPVVSLTGKVVLTRDEESGLITSYREFWDQNVNDVLKTAKFGKKA